MSPFLAEFIGTTTLLYLGNGVNANVSLKKTYGNESGWLVISLGWGLAVFMGVVISGSSSGGHLNPAVSLGLAVVGKFSWCLVPGYILAQMLGAIMGAFLVFIQYKDHFTATVNARTKLGVFATLPAIKNNFNNIISEILGTCMLVFGVFYIIDGEGIGSLNALPVGLLVTVIGLSLGGSTSYAINPARDLGPRIFHALIIDKRSDWKYAWIPVLGPLMGAVLAGFLFKIL
tara:strand:- start:875 stop:1567 length:693 start_codon:yes stop_codon:yes gene_type:complete